ncbi:MAG: DUF2341 domain-containing protein, partial [Crocinitomicaceae bacterium]|nr:DUF2341 domain-containing protein [Crocinitomicaceae bacterium]
MRILLMLFLFSGIISYAQVDVDRSIHLTGAGVNARITGIDSVGANQKDAVNVKSIQSGKLTYAFSGGSAGHYLLNLIPPVAAYYEGMNVCFKANHNSGAAATLEINSLGQKGLFRNATQQVMCGEIESGAIVTAVYDGSKFQVTSNLSEATESWSYRMPVNITNSIGTLSDYQVLVTFNHSALVSAGKSNATGYDLRFTAVDGITQLNYWIESGVNTGSCKVWVKVPSLPTGSTTIYMYYDSTPKPDISSGINTFVFFDDFNGVSNGSRPANPDWPITGISQVQNGRLRLMGTAEVLSTNVGTEHIIEGNAQMTAASSNQDFRIQTMLSATTNCAAFNNYIENLIPWEGGDSRADKVNTLCSATANIITGGPKYTNYNFRLTTYVSGGLTYMTAV